MPLPAVGGGGGCRGKACLTSREGGGGRLGLLGLLGSEGREVWARGAMGRRPRPWEGARSRSGAEPSSIPISSSTSAAPTPVPAPAPADADADADAAAAAAAAAAEEDGMRERAADGPAGLALARPCPERPDAAKCKRSERWHLEFSDEAERRNRGRWKTREGTSRRLAAPSIPRVAGTALAHPRSWTPWPCAGSTRCRGTSGRWGRGATAGQRGRSRSRGGSG